MSALETVTLPSELEQPLQTLRELSTPKIPAQLLAFFADGGVINRIDEALVAIERAVDKAGDEEPLGTLRPELRFLRDKSASFRPAVVFASEAELW